MNKHTKILQLIAVTLTFLVNVVTAQTEQKMKTTSVITKADEKHSFNEYKAVEEALQPYISAAKTGNSDKFKNTFFEHVRILGSLNGEFYNSDLPTFKTTLSQIASANVKHHIAWIDITGTAGAAKVEFIDWSGFRFTDYFVLFKHEGQWKISGEVFDAHSNQ